MTRENCLKHVKCLFGQHDNDGLPPNLDCKSFVSDMGKYFEQKITNIRSQLDNNELSSVPDDPQIASPVTESNVPQFSEFTPLSESDANVLISRSSLKTCQP